MDWAEESRKGRHVTGSRTAAYVRERTVTRGTGD
jgi:hypothetical protein